MEFPHLIRVFGVTVHPHLLFEVIAYSAGFQLYLLLRRRWPRREATLPFERNLWVIVGACSARWSARKLLALLESPQHYWAIAQSPRRVRRRQDDRRRTARRVDRRRDRQEAHRHRPLAPATSYVFPLILGMCVGRVGCFLTGLADHTHGVHDVLPWAVNFGDGAAVTRRSFTRSRSSCCSAAALLRPHAPAVDRTATCSGWFMLGYLRVPLRRGIHQADRAARAGAERDSTRVHGRGVMCRGSLRADAPRSSCCRPHGNRHDRVRRQTPFPRPRRVGRCPPVLP